MATLLSAITDHLANRPEPAPQALTTSCAITTFLDYLVPVPKSAVDADLRLEQFPEWYRLRYVAVRKDRIGASFGEIFPTYGSIVMLVATLVYVFSK